MPLRGTLLAIALLTVPALLRAQDEPARKAPPERTYSNTPYVHRIPLLDEQGGPIKLPRPGEDAAAGVNTNAFSLAKTCGKCHSDYDVMQRGWHFNFADANAPRGRPGEPWILTDPQTRTQLPLSYRGWGGTFHPYDVGINDFNFARLFGRHLPGGGPMQNSKDLRFTMSGPLENDCLICHVSDARYDPKERANQISIHQNYRYAPALAAFLGNVQGSASKLRDNFDPTGPDAKRAPKVNYDPARFNDVNEVVINLARRVPNERCYFCHTSIAGDPESRWSHDGDIHLVKGILCVDCHKNGADHMIVRGYEGEYEDRAKAGLGADKTIATLSCQGCHYGTYDQRGGRNAAPRPLHHGLPTLHFAKLTCTACHSGPMPTTQTTTVMTAMSHRLGLPRHHTEENAAPVIQQPVFLRDERTHKIAPYRVLFPSYWAWVGDGKVTPILPEQVTAAAADVLGEKPDAKEAVAIAPLTQEQVLQVLQKLAAAPPATVKPADAITARGATTAPATVASTQPHRGPIYISGARTYRLDGGKLVVTDSPQDRYAWALAHDVRGAQQAVGARGCTECHANGAPIFDSTLSSASVLPASGTAQPMYQLRHDSMGPLRMFAATYRFRWSVIALGYLSATVLLLVYLKQKLPTIGGGE